MKLTYIYHSCFAIEGEWFTIILDYFKDAGGIVHDYLLTRPGKFYVMATILTLKCYAGKKNVPISSISFRKIY